MSNPACYGQWKKSERSSKESMIRSRNVTFCVGVQLKISTIKRGLSFLRKCLFLLGQKYGKLTEKNSKKMFISLKKQESIKVFDAKIRILMP